MKRTFNFQTMGGGYMVPSDILVVELTLKENKNYEQTIGSEYSPVPVYHYLPTNVSVALFPSTKMVTFTSNAEDATNGAVKSLRRIARTTGLRLEELPRN